MRSHLVTTVAPTVDPVSLADMRFQLRLTDTASDTLINELMRAARNLIENATSHTINTTTYRWELDEFPLFREIELPRAPYDATGFLIDYFAVDAASTTNFAPTKFEVHDRGELPAIVELDTDQNWPATHDRLDAVQITFNAGHASTATVPENVKQAMKILVTHWFENPQAVVIGKTSKAIEFALDACIDSMRTGQQISV